jgi:hypothetical protein
MEQRYEDITPGMIVVGVFLGAVYMAAFHVLV